jgi:UDP-N-acetylmuramate--alanine ligase
MHIYFSGIGGAGIGPLALIAHQAGYTVSGSDKKESQYTKYLQKHGIELHIGQEYEQIKQIHTTNPIDWLVMSSAILLENPSHPELVFAKEYDIKISKRDELLNLILTEKNLKLIAVAGTHGKTTATAMLIWACQKLGLPVSYSVGAKTSFADMGHFDPKSHYFLYECDEFDRNFLQFSPLVSIITVVDWDHHDIFETRQSYKDAFRQFIDQSDQTVLFERDASYLELEDDASVTRIDQNDTLLSTIELAGQHNRQNALVVANGLSHIIDTPLESILAQLSTFPGSERRFEKLAPNVYTDYAHTPEEISATLQLAEEISDSVVVVYEPLTNKRQHFMKDMYSAVFQSAKKVYWLPSYLAREDPAQHVLTPEELIAHLSAETHAEATDLNDTLFKKIEEHAANGDLVLCLAGGGGNSLDEFLRARYKV